MQTNTSERLARPAGLTIPPGLARQQRERDKALRRLAKLRRKAADEIDRLLAFLDASDPYVSRELEEDGEEADASYSEGGPRMFANHNEDDEDSADSEPSLGSSGHGSAGPITYVFHAISDGSQMVIDCELDDSDREPSLGAFESLTFDQEVAYMVAGDGMGVPDDTEVDRSDWEPNLGWSKGGALGGTSDFEITSPEAVL